MFIGAFNIFDLNDEISNLEKVDINGDKQDPIVQAVNISESSESELNLNAVTEIEDCVLLSDDSILETDLEEEQ